MGCRQLLVAQLGDVAVGTVHLESLANHPMRERQLRSCESILASHSNAILVGDFNFDSEQNFKPPHEPLENEALVQIMPEFVDLWPALRAERGLTFDSGVNPYIGKSEHMRYDRVMTRLTSWRATAIDMFGQEPVDHLVQLTPWEQEYAERPPTPPRPQPRPLAPPAFAADAWGPLGDWSPRNGGSTGCEQTPLQPSTSCEQTPLQPSTLREQTPPRARSKFFLSDHFGLIAELVPIRG